MIWNRRFLIKLVGSGAALQTATPAMFLVPATSSAANDRSAAIDSWLRRMSLSKTVSALPMGKFEDGPRYSLKQVALSQGSEVIVVPRGFVTTFRSVPISYWTLIHPDITSLLLALVHDYLYWSGTKPKLAADRVLGAGLQELALDDRASKVMGDVKSSGQAVWDTYRILRSRGERRVLSQIPDVPTTWRAWRADKGNLSDH
jgi:hypothetical protein